jgi:hypothetical protein
MFSLQLAGLLGGPVTSFVWYPVLPFEVALALLLTIKGVAGIASAQRASQ